MKQILLSVFICSIIFFSSCELKYSHYHVYLSNRSSYRLIVDYETFEQDDVVTIEKNGHFSFYSQSFDEVLPTFTGEDFNDIIYKVNISAILDNGDTLTLSKDFSQIEHWGYSDSYDDLHIIHKYYLNITDEDFN